VARCDHYKLQQPGNEITLLRGPWVTKEYARFPHPLDISSADTSAQVPHQYYPNLSCVLEFGSMSFILGNGTFSIEGRGKFVNDVMGSSRLAVLVIRHVSRPF